MRRGMSTAGKVIESGLWFKELSDNRLKRRNWNVAKADTRRPVVSQFLPSMKKMVSQSVMFGEVNRGNGFKY